ncbi:hypothetical protein [Aneurinibacillus terranovensis]|uniref:hypothetical protein n=1 Tax=Aneurinibacillus terranovensis TaxID=278991 RepID=UPI000408A4F8|nr:hypothetical protein [Aneurinibacillus terranovensis]
MGRFALYRMWREQCEEVKQGHVAIEEDFLAIQEFVDKGGNPWRLDPVETARRVGVAKLGFYPNDTFTLSGYYISYDSGLNHALVHATHGICLFLIELRQPVRQGRRGIWAVERVTLLNP